MDTKALSEMFTFLNGYDFGAEWEDIVRPLLSIATTELKNMKDNEEWSSDKIVELAELVKENIMLKERDALQIILIAKLRADLRKQMDEAIRVIEELTHPLDYDTQFAHAAAFLEKSAHAFIARMEETK
jgi:hypothetical protein